MLKSFEANGDGNKLFEEESILARARNLTPLRFRLELVVTYLEQPFEYDAAVVFTCERRGAIFATNPAEAQPGEKRRLFNESIVLDLLLFRKSGFDDEWLIGSEVIANGEPISGFDPVMTRLTLRESLLDGIVIDCVAVDLSNFILGAHGVVEDILELQLGSHVGLRVITDLCGPSPEELPSPSDDLKYDSSNGPLGDSSSFQDGCLGDDSANRLPRDPDDAKPGSQNNSNVFPEEAGGSEKITLPIPEKYHSENSEDRSSVKCKDSVAQEQADVSEGVTLPTSEREKFKGKLSCGSEPGPCPEEEAFQACASSSWLTTSVNDATSEVHIRAVPQECDKSSETNIPTDTSEANVSRPNEQHSVSKSSTGQLLKRQSSHCLGIEKHQDNIQNENQSPEKGDGPPAQASARFISLLAQEVTISQKAEEEEVARRAQEAADLRKRREAVRRKEREMAAEASSKIEAEARKARQEAYLNRSRSQNQLTSCADTDSTSGMSDDSERDQFSETGSELDNDILRGKGSRVQLEDHPFTEMITTEKLPQPYLCFVDEGHWEEHPVVSHVRCPFSLNIWSIQGPQEIDPDDEDDLMDIGDGMLGPKRNIQKLQSAATCSNVKHGKPALPGNMSPLQRSNIRPSRTREAIVIALGRPSRPSQLTVLSASKELEQDVIHIDEPDLTDSEFEESEDGDNSDVRRSPNSFSVPHPNGDEQAKDGGTSAAVLEGMGPDDDSRKEMEIRQTASQVAELMNRINELDAEIVSVKQVLKKTRTLAADLRSERDYLKTLLDEKEIQGTADAGFEQGNTAKEDELCQLERDRVEYEKNLGSMLAKLEEAKQANQDSTKELRSIQEDMARANSLRNENDRLLAVILSLNNELDRDHGSPDVLDMLQDTRAALAKEQEESQKLRDELGELKASKKASSSPKKKKKNTLFAGSPKSASPRSVTDF